MAEDTTFLSSTKKTIGLPFLAVLWVGFFWGTTWIASKLGTKYISGLQLAAIRQLFSGLLYIGYFSIQKAPWPKPKQWPPIVIMAVLNFTLSNGLSTAGIKYINSGLGAIIATIFPIWIVIISYFRGDKVAKLAVIGMLVSFVGVCVVFYEHLPEFLLPNFQTGILLSLIATVTWAFGTLYTKKNAATFNPYFSLGLQMFLSSIFLFAYLGASNNAIEFDKIPINTWFVIGYLVIVGSVITFSVFMYSLQKLPAEISSIYAYINPIVAVVLGAILFNETLTLPIIFGGSITLAGLYLVNKSLRQENKKTRILIK